MTVHLPGSDPAQKWAQETNIESKSFASVPTETSSTSHTFTNAHHVTRSHLLSLAHSLHTALCLVTLRLLTPSHPPGDRDSVPSSATLDQISKLPV